MVELFCKISQRLSAINCFCKNAHHKYQTVLTRKKKETNFFILHFYIMLNDVINCSAFVDIKQTLHYKEQSKYNQKDVYFLCIVSYVCFIYLRWTKFLMVVLDRLFSFVRQKKWSLVALDRRSSYTVTIAREFALAGSELAVLDKQSFYRGARLNRFHCNALS